MYTFIYFFVLCYVFIYIFIFMAEPLCCFVLYFIFCFVVLFYFFFMAEHHGFVPPWSWYHIKRNNHQNSAICLCYVCAGLVSFNETNQHNSRTNEQHWFREIWTALGGEWRHCPELCLFLKRGNIYDVHFNGTNWAQINDTSFVWLRWTGVESNITFPENNLVISKQGKWTQCLF